jgi:hypothetical protein
MAKKKKKLRIRKQIGGCLPNLHKTQRQTREQRELEMSQRELDRRIPDRVEQDKYLTAVINAFTITCDCCDLKESCDNNYEDCQYNPANE